MSGERPLIGCRIVTTRDEPGELDALLASLGAEVVHVPLIEIVDADDGGAQLDTALATLADGDWLIVTSRHGATRVGEAAAGRPGVRLAAVGTRTAAELARGAGRAVDIVPSRQTAADLLTAMPDGAGARAVVAQADRAERTLADGLVDRGYLVVPVVAYRTLLRTPTTDELAAALGCDAVAFASGSAAEAWASTIGPAAPPCVVAIGPTTAGVASEHGIAVTHVAGDHSVAGLAQALVEALDAREPGPTR